MVHYFYLFRRICWEIAEMMDWSSASLSWQAHYLAESLVLPSSSGRFCLMSQYFRRLNQWMIAGPCSWWWKWPPLLHHFRRDVPCCFFVVWRRASNFSQNLGCFEPAPKRCAKPVSRVLRSNVHSACNFGRNSLAIFRALNFVTTQSL